MFSSNCEMFCSLRKFFEALMWPAVRTVEGGVGGTILRTSLKPPLPESLLACLDVKVGWQHYEPATKTQ